MKKQTHEEPPGPTGFPGDDRQLPPIKKMAYLSVSAASIAVTIWVIYIIFICGCN